MSARHGRSRSEVASFSARWYRDPRTALLLMVGAFTAVFSLTAALRYGSFATYAWDLGIYNQAVHSTVFSHRFFYYTADLPAGTQGSLFAVHFSPFLFLLLPPYFLVPSPATLLVLQTVGVAAAALPLYGIARDRLGSPRWGLVVAALYLISPVTQGLTWYDFHPESFLPLTVLSALFFLGRRRYFPFLLACLLALAVVEEIAPFLALFALLSVTPLLVQRLRGVTLTAEQRRAARWFTTALLLSAAWALIAYEALLRAGAVGGGAFGANYAVNWTVLGAPSPAWVFPQAIAHPGLAILALSFDLGPKLLYVLLLFGTVAFLPWIGEDRTLFPVLAWVGLALLSNNPAYYQLGDQYSAYALPFLYAGTVEGLVHARPSWARWRAWWSQVVGKLLARGRELRSPPSVPRPDRGIARSLRWLAQGERPLAMGLLALALVATLVASPLLPSPAASFGEITYGVPRISPHDALLQQVIGMIPSQASVLTTTTLFPEVSGRTDAYVLPTSSYFLGNRTFAGVLDGYVNDSRFILVDYRVDVYSAVILTTFVNLTDFGLYAEADGAYLYERGWQGPPALYLPWAPTTIEPSSLVIGAAAIETSLPGAPLHHAPQGQEGTELWSGPGLYPLPPGTYQVTLTLRVLAPARERTALLDLVRTPVHVGVDVLNPSSTGHDYGFVESVDPSESALANLTAISSGPGNGWENVTLIGSWPYVGTLNCEGWLAGPNVDLWLYGIQVQQVSAVPL